MNGILLVSLFSRMSLGISIVFSASRREVGKNIASVFDFVIASPTCIWSPKWVKWLKMAWDPVCRSILFLKRKAPLSTYRKLSMRKGVPLEVVGSPRSLPHWVFGFFVWGKCQNSALDTMGSWSISMMACIMKRNSVGAILSPCCMPVS